MYDMPVEKSTTLHSNNKDTLSELLNAPQAVEPATTLTSPQDPSSLKEAKPVKLIFLK